MKRKNKRHFVVGILFVSMLVVVGQMVWIHLKNSSLFKIKTVVVSDPSMQFIKASRLVNLKGKSIFALDLKPLTEKLQAQYPEIAQIKLLKRFPDQIAVATKRRVAFAQVRMRNKDITVDGQGVILSMGLSVSPLQDLPLIVGVDSQKAWASPGRQLQGQDIKTALTLIKVFRSNKYLSVYKILKIDVKNLSQIEFYMTDIDVRTNHATLSKKKDVEIRTTSIGIPFTEVSALKGIVDQNNLFDKIQMLSLMLSQAKLKLDEINYIDLRFKEPIIGKKMGNNK